MLCFILLWLHNYQLVIRVIYLCVSIRVAHLALVQSYGCSSAGEETLKDMDKSIDIYRNKT